MSPSRPDLVEQLAHTAADLAPALGLPSGEELLRSVCATARRVFGAAACSVSVLDEDEGVLEFRAADGEGAADIVGVRLSIDRGIAGYVASSGIAIAVDDVRDDPRFAADFAEATGYVPERLLVVPVTAETGEVLGVLSLLDPDEAMVGELDLLDLATSFAHQAGLGLALVTAVEDLGATLLSALADAAARGEPELGDALRRRARTTRGSDATIAAVAANIGELRRRGPGISGTASRILDELVAHARAARGRRR